MKFAIEGNFLKILLLKLAEHISKFQILIKIIIKFIDFYLQKE